MVSTKFSIWLIIKNVLENKAQMKKPLIQISLPGSFILCLATATLCDALSGGYDTILIL